jgi:hypothetical protein
MLLCDRCVRMKRSRPSACTWESPDSRQAGRQEELCQRHDQRDYMQSANTSSRGGFQCWGMRLVGNAPAQRLKHPMLQVCSVSCCQQHYSVAAAAVRAQIHTETDAQTDTHTWSATLVAMNRQVNRMERRVAAVLSASSPVTLGGSSEGCGEVADSSSTAQGAGRCGVSMVHMRVCAARCHNHAAWCLVM